MPSIEASQPVHVVAGIIRDPDKPSKIFFTQRQKGQHLEDLWEFPGGKLEQGETRFQGLKRELEEEAGIQVITARPFQTVIHAYKEKTILLDVWEVSRYSGYAHGREGQEFRWLSLQELDQYAFPEADHPILKALALPAELLITPEIPLTQLDQSLEYFFSLMQQYRYPLVQFRSHLLNDRNYLSSAKELKAICAQYRSELIINRPELKSYHSKGYDAFTRRHLNASILNAEKSNPFEAGIRCSASCHDQQEINKAAAYNCDFALLSSVKESSSHPGRAGQGWYGFKQIAMQSKIPVYALGGVNRKDITVARYHSAIGVAGISDFWERKSGLKRA
ncbi:MAG: Nudix family hydrolase [Gammaproteobacteria bacterium]|nr:Nudix family hydrolase [Gammaproteobacteria bacterium]MBL6998476.1 Nudix family hydrolase [Gammaproteobacteria bacterium]